MAAKSVDQQAVQILPSCQWIGLIIVYLFLPLVLLVCGGDDLNGWPGWRWTSNQAYSRSTPVRPRYYQYL